MGDWGVGQGGDEDVKSTVDRNVAYGFWVAQMKKAGENLDSQNGDNRPGAYDD